MKNSSYTAHEKFPTDGNRIPFKKYSNKGIEKNSTKEIKTGRLFTNTKTYLVLYQT